MLGYRWWLPAAWARCWIDYSVVGDWVAVRLCATNSATTVAAYGPSLTVRKCFVSQVLCDLYYNAKRTGCHAFIDSVGGGLLIIVPGIKLIPGIYCKELIK